MDVLPVQLRGVEQRMGRWSSGARPISLSPSPAWRSAPQPARAEEDTGQSGAVYTSVFLRGVYNLFHVLLYKQLLPFCIPYQLCGDGPYGDSYGRAMRPSLVLWSTAGTCRDSCRR